MWKAQELLDSLNRECSLTDLNELYKALVAYELNITTITSDTNKLLDGVLEEYYDYDWIPSFVNQDIINLADLQYRNKNKNN